MRTLSRRGLGAVAVGALAARPALAQYAEAKPLKPTADSPWTEEGFVQRGGLRMHYLSMGTGPVVVLQHKLGGWAADWRRIAPALAKAGYRVVSIDMPGHGESTVNGPVPFLQSLPESAAAVMETLNELKVDTFDFIGNSLGGCVGVLMAAHWPERFKHLILLSVALGSGESREQLVNDVDQPGTWGPNGEPLPRSFEEQKKRFGFTDIKIHEENEASRKKAGLWVRASERGVGAHNIVAELPKITAPTLLIYGERGGYHQYEKPGLAGLKRVRSVTIPNAGSHTHQDDPRATEKVALAFLAEPLTR